jgi:hypothetical protein
MWSYDRHIPGIFQVYTVTVCRHMSGIYQVYTIIINFLGFPDDLRYRRTTSKVQNVDIDWAFDIEVFEIECYARYRRSDTRYRGGKDPDVPSHRDWQLGTPPVYAAPAHRASSSSSESPGPPDDPATGRPRTGRRAAPPAAPRRRTARPLVVSLA